MKRLIIAVSFLFAAQIAMAETCPSLHDIKQGLTSDWSLFDSETGQPLTAKETQTFTKNVSQFALAEWHRRGQGAEIRCHYRDIDGSSMEAYLTKGDFYPDKSTDRWYQVSGSLHCAAGLDRCAFTPAQTPNHQLARQ